MTSEHWDLHTDGTSKNGKKYVGQQVTTESGSLSGGFVPVAREDTTTLVELTIGLLEELSKLYPAGEAEQNFANMLQGMSAVMSDRAPAMKSFGKQLNNERKLLLQTDKDLDFLHCNAHFLQY